MLNGSDSWRSVCLILDQCCPLAPIAADKLNPKATNCVSQNVIVTLYKTPEANQLREFYRQAVATCSKQ